MGFPRHLDTIWKVCLSELLHESETSQCQWVPSRRFFFLFSSCTPVHLLCIQLWPRWGTCWAMTALLPSSLSSSGWHGDTQGRFALSWRPSCGRSSAAWALCWLSTAPCPWRRRRTRSRSSWPMMARSFSGGWCLLPRSCCVVIWMWNQVSKCLMSLFACQMWILNANAVHSCCREFLLVNSFFSCLFFFFL